MTFKFTHTRNELVKEIVKETVTVDGNKEIQEVEREVEKPVTKTYDVKLTNGLIIDVEEAYDKPVDTMWHVSKGKSSIMAKGKLAIYVGVLNHLAIREMDTSLSTTMQELKVREDINWNSEEVNVNAIFFFEALIKQQAEFRKIPKDKGTKTKKK